MLQGKGCLSRAVRFFFLSAVLTAGFSGLALGRLAARGAAAAETAKLVVFTGAAEPSQLPAQEKVRDAFEKAHPGVKVQLLPVPWPWLTKFSAMLAAGTPPDLVVPGPTTEFLDQGVWLNVDPLVARDKVDISRYFEPIWKYASQLGIRYGMPVSMYTDAVFYNKDLLDAAGLIAPPHTYADSSWTWERYVEYARKITKDTNGDGVPEIWGMDGLGNTYTMLQSFDAYPFSQDMRTVRFDTPAMVKGFELLQRVYKEHLTPTYAERVAQNLGGVGFTTGKVGMLIDFTARYRSLLPIKNLSWDLAAKPRGPAGPRVLLYTDTINIVKGAGNTELAWEYAKFVTSPAMLPEFSLNGLKAIPPTPEGTSLFIKAMEQQKPDVDWMVFIRGVPYSNPPNPWHPAYQQVNDLVSAVQTKIAEQQVDIRPALKSLTEQAQVLVDEYWAKRKS
ncbi:MAG: sugar ABC transporter substrate-binding protein [Limnochordaceae bacterium]|nr:sugar ABC transporter substrate-binding protein [Limnochordaceae bacterium]